MARISFDDKIYKDQRFVELTLKLSSTETAIGALVRAWSVAQEYWKKDCSLIPFDVWKKQKLNDVLIDVGLAVSKDTGFYMVGSKDHFDWLLKSVQSGKKGGRPKKEPASSEFNNLGETPSKGSKRVSNLIPIPIPIEESKDSSEERVSPGAPPFPSVEKIDQLCQAWNQIVTSLPKVKSSIGKRRVLILRSLKENSDLEYWRRVFAKVEASDFLSGRNGRWTACNFDWILSNDKNGIRNHVRVDEGVHDNRQTVKVQRNPQMAGTDWVVEAEAILEAVRRFGANNPTDAQKFLGDVRWGYVRKAGGLYRIGQMPRNDFTSKQLAGILRASCEQQNNPSERIAKNASLEHQDQKFHERSRGGDQARSNQPSRGQQQSGQIDDFESLRVRSEGVLGLVTGPAGGRRSGSDRGTGRRDGDSTSPVSSGKTNGVSEQGRIRDEIATGATERDVRVGIVQSDFATGPEGSTRNDHVKHRPQAGSEEALRPAWDSSGETSDGEL